MPHGRPGVNSAGRGFGDAARRRPFRALRTTTPKAARGIAGPPLVFASGWAPSACQPQALCGFGGLRLFGLIRPDAARVVDDLAGALGQRHVAEHVVIDEHDQDVGILQRGVEIDERGAGAVELAGQFGGIGDFLC